MSYWEEGRIVAGFETAERRAAFRAMLALENPPWLDQVEDVIYEHDGRVYALLMEFNQSFKAHSGAECMFERAADDHFQGFYAYAIVGEDREDLREEYGCARDEHGDDADWCDGMDFNSYAWIERKIDGFSYSQKG